MKKVALIIGNGDYLHSGRLKNPTNDSRDMKSSLEKLGFEIIYGENLTKKDMNRKLKEFGQIAKGSETALFYYAGHGLQSQGENFLLPINAEIDSFEDIPEESMSFQRVESEFENMANQNNIFILDACRDNPFEEKMKKQASLQGRNIDFSRGLANPNMHIGNSIIAYSTSPNDIALDSPHEENGVYTKYLKTAILETGLSIESVFKRVAKAVKLETSQSQTPWVHSNSDEDIYLNGKPKEKVVKVDNSEQIIKLEKETVEIIEIARNKIKQESKLFQKNNDIKIENLNYNIKLAIEQKNFQELYKQKAKLEKIEEEAKIQESIELKKLEKLEFELRESQNREISQLKNTEQNLQSAKSKTIFSKTKIVERVKTRDNSLIWSGKGFKKFNIDLAEFNNFENLKKNVYEKLKILDLKTANVLDTKPHFERNFNFRKLILPIKNVVPRPKQIPNILPKGEFEKSSDFELRKAKFYTQQRESQLNYEREVKLSELKFQSDTKLAKDRYFQEKEIVKKKFDREYLEQRAKVLLRFDNWFFENKTSLFNSWLGSQKIEMNYNADKEVFDVSINKYITFQVAVPVNLAEKFKRDVNSFELEFDEKRNLLGIQTELNGKTFFGKGFYTKVLIKQERESKREQERRIREIEEHSRKIQCKKRRREEAKEELDQLRGFTEYSEPFMFTYLIILVIMSFYFSSFTNNPIIMGFIFIMAVSGLMMMLDYILFEPIMKYFHNSKQENLEQEIKKLDKELR